MGKKVVQIVLAEDQTAIIDTVLTMTKTKISVLVRRLLLEWCAARVTMRGAIRGGKCGAQCNKICSFTPATWFNTAAKDFVCEPCALHLNTKYLVCVVANDEHQPAISVEKLRAAIAEEQSKTNSDDELLSDLLRAADAYGKRTSATVNSKIEKVSTEKRKSASFDALVERFAVDE